MSDLELIELALRRVADNEEASFAAKQYSRQWLIEFCQVLADELVKIRTSREASAHKTPEPSP